MTGMVKMGCRRSLVYRTAYEIALRNMSLAILLIIVGVAISYRLTDVLARPLEDLAGTVRRVAQGELDAPLVPLGSREVASLGASVARMAGDLRQARMLRETLARLTCPQAQQAPLPPVSLLVRLEGADEAERENLLQALLDAVCNNEGRLVAVAPGHVLAVFGEADPEQDDVLRAVVAALEWQEGAGGGPQVALVDLAGGEGATAAERLEALRAVLGQAEPEGAGTYVTQAAAEAAGEHLELAPSAAGGLWRVREPEDGLSEAEAEEEEW